MLRGLLGMSSDFSTSSEGSLSRVRFYTEPWLCPAAPKLSSCRNWFPTLLFFCSDFLQDQMSDKEHQFY